MLPFLSGILYPLLFPKFNLYFLFPVVLVPIIIFALNAKKGSFQSPSFPFNPPIPPFNKGGMGGFQRGMKGDFRVKVFVYSWVAGTLSNIILLYWLYPTMRMNNVGSISSAVGLILFSSYMGIYWGIFGAGVYSIRKFKLLLIPSIWVLLEYVRTYLFTGFPWLLVGYSMWKIPEFLQISGWTGIYGLSFIVIFINTAIALSINTKKIKPVIIAAAVTGIVFIYGHITVKRYNTEEDLKVSILQGNISQYKKWNLTFKQEILDTYRKLHRKAITYKPDIVVWPETSVPDALITDTEVNLYIKKLAEKGGAYELLGSIESTGGNYYNSAYMVTPSGEVSEPYRKIHILPFGEYFPFRSLLSVFAGIISGLEDFDAGNEYVLFKVKDYRICTGICFESIFPDIIRKFFKRGANIFVNITNDGWFLNTAGPYQHFIHSVVRAVENRTYVIRSANTGISAIISPTGRIIKKTELLEASVLNGRVGKSEKKTFYTEYGNIFVYVCLLFTIVAVILSQRM